MPVFGNRTLVSMLRDLPNDVRERCQADLSGRLTRGGTDAIAAEWELFVLRQLAMGGTLRLAPADQAGVPDAIFNPNGGAPVVVEITALNDQDLEESFADDVLGMLFYRAITRLTKRHVGSLDVITQWPIGLKGLPTPGLPPRSQMHAFMRTPEVRDFVRAIASAPDEPRTFKHRDGQALTTVHFKPGARYSSGSTSGYLARSFNAHNRGRLLRKLGKKVKQLSNSNLAMPAVLVLCDADCAMLRERHMSPWARDGGATHAIFDFISGRPTLALPGPVKPWIVQKGAPQQTTSINAVLILTVEERRAWNLPGIQRQLKVSVIRSEGPAKHPLDDDDFQTLIDCILTNVPPILRSPMNAKHERARSDNEGGGQVSGNRIRLPLLAVQDLLTGRMTQEDFVRRHDFMAQHLARLAARGQCISSSRVVQDDRGKDDDWIELDFSGLDPRDLRGLLTSGEG